MVILMVILFKYSNVNIDDHQHTLGCSMVFPEIFAKTQQPLPSTTPRLADDSMNLGAQLATTVGLWICKDTLW